MKIEHTLSHVPVPGSASLAVRYDVTVAGESASSYSSAEDACIVLACKLALLREVNALRDARVVKP